jgi:WD40 repeat protein
MKKRVSPFIAMLLLVVGAVLTWTVVFRDRSAFPVGGAAYIDHLAFSPNGVLFAAATDSSVHIWTTADRRRVTEISRGEAQHALAWSPDSQRIAIEGPDGAVDVYDPISGLHLGSFKNPNLKRDNILDLAWSTQDQIAVGYVGNHVEVINGSTYEIIYSFVLPDPIGDYPWNATSEVTFTSNGTLLAAGSSDEHIRLWQMVDGSLVHDIVPERQGFIALAFNPMGTLLASGGPDGSINLWDVATGRLHASLTGHSAPVGELAFLPDGRRLVSGAGYGPDIEKVDLDATVRVWDVTTQHLITILGNHHSRVLDVAVSPDGQSIASSGWGDGIKLWTLPEN